MGVPIAALGALAAAAGTAAQVQASRKTTQAQNAAINAELARQQSFREQGDRAFQTSLAQSTEPVAQAQHDAGAASRDAIQARLANVPLSASQGAPIQSQGVDTVTPTLQRSAAANSNLLGYSEWDLRQWIKNLRAQEDLRILNQFARGSANVLPYELQDASRSHATLNSIGQMLQAAGGVAGSFGGPTGSLLASPIQSQGLDKVPMESQIATKNAKLGYGYE